MNASFQELSPSWLARLQSQFDLDYMVELETFLSAERQSGKVIFPEASLIFHALNSVDFDSVRVVILGQDPYHGPRQAHGLSFSVPEGERIPPSLRNIYKEIERDLSLSPPTNGCLQSWADQGVLLLNAMLTVEQAKAGSHQGKGWEMFTDEIIRQLSEDREGVVFLLWGSYAQKKGQVIDRQKHCVLESAHPSPLSAHRGFLGNGHFSKANQYLEARGAKGIDWSVADVNRQNSLF
ncbi:MAG: uracil-DNA glycosylase [Cellvibrionaceae bacterium]